MSIEKVQLSSLVAQAWEQLRGMLLEEAKKRIEELARVEQAAVWGGLRMAEKGITYDAGGTGFASWR